MRETPVLTSPPLQFLIPAVRRWHQSPCILANASCICSGLSGVLASGGGKNNEQAGNADGCSHSGESSLRLLLAESPDIPNFRLPETGEDA
jgi:hypothetical protein